MNLTIGKFNSLEAFKLAYYDANKRTAGAKNPVRIRARHNSLNNKRKQLLREIKEGVHNSLLNKCAVTGTVGQYGQDIRAAVVKVEKDGIEAAYNILISNKVRKGVSYRGGKVVSVSRRGMRAKVATVQMGDAVMPVVTVIG